MRERDQGSFQPDILLEVVVSDEIVETRNRMRHLYKSLAFITASGVSILVFDSSFVHAVYVGLSAGIGAAADIYVNNKYFAK